MKAEVLILASGLHESGLAKQAVEEAGAKAVFCGNLPELLGKLNGRAEAIIGSQGMLLQEPELLAKALADSPERSSLPILILMNPEDGTEAASRFIERLGNNHYVTPLNDTATPFALTSMLRAALSARIRERELREKSRTLEAFFHLSSTPLAFMDRSFRFIRVNKAFAGITERDPDSIIGKKCIELFPDCQCEPILEQVIKTRRPYRAYAKPYIDPNDPQRKVTYWNWWLAPLLDSAGEIEALVFTPEDVTERQNAAIELNHRTKQLQKLSLALSAAEDRERHRLSEILHDDLQQVLVAAKFHLTTLENRMQASSGKLIVAEIERMLSEAIRKSRDLSHELSPAVLHRSDFSEILDWLANQVHETHGLEVDINSSGMVLIQSDALRNFLYKSAQELLFNVVKHARTKHAKVRIRKIFNHLCLSVTDQGRGFDPGSLREAEGFGIFSIRERVELLGGRMRIRSSKGKGSELTIIIPDMEPATTGVHPTELLPCVEAGTGQKTRLRVLIADDHEIVREGLASLLSEQHDMEVVAQAGNGRDAVNLAGELRPDVVVMDASMPLMNGDEATRQIKTFLPRTRIVVLSMFEQEEMIQRMYRAGVEGYVLKTAPPEELLAAIRSRTYE